MEKYILKHNVLILHDKEKNGYIITNFSTSFFLKKIKSTDNFFIFLKNGINEKILKVNNLFEYNKIFKKLKNANFLIKKWEKVYENSIFSRTQYFYEVFDLNPTEVINKIKNLKFCVLGCGGIGNVILRDLVYMGVSNLIIVDFDIIEYSNLNRQYFFKLEDIGKNKVNTIKDRLLEINKNLNLKTYNLKISQSEDLSFIEKEIDYLINAADSPYNLEQIVLNYIIDNNNIKKYCHCGIGEQSSLIGPILTKTSEMIKYRNFLNKNDYLKQQINPTPASHGITNNISSSILSLEILKDILGIESVIKNRIMKFNIMNYSHEVYSYE